MPFLNAGNSGWCPGLRHHSCLDITGGSRGSTGSKRQVGSMNRKGVCHLSGGRVGWLFYECNWTCLEESLFGTTLHGIGTPLTCRQLLAAQQPFIQKSTPRAANASSASDPFLQYNARRNGWHPQQASEYRCNHTVLRSALPLDDRWLSPRVRRIRSARSPPHLQTGEPSEITPLTPFLAIHRLPYCSPHEPDGIEMGA